MSKLRALRKRFRRRWKNKPGPIPWLLFQPTRLVLAFLHLLPTTWIMAVGGGGGRLAWLFSRRRRVGRFQIGKAFPDMPAKQRDRILKQSCSSLGQSAVEAMYCAGRLRDEMAKGFSYEGDAEQILRAAAGKGAVLVQAHFGSFEIGGAGMSFLGLNPAFPMRAPNNYYMAQYVMKAREGWGVTLLPKRGAVRPMMRHMRAGGAVVLATDQNAHQAPIFVPWFDYPAATERAAAALALKMGVPLLVFWCTRNPGVGSWTIGCESLLEGGEKQQATDQAVYDLNLRIHHCLEQAIRRTPEQYLWIHDRYRTRPEDQT